MKRLFKVLLFLSAGLLFSCSDKNEDYLLKEFHTAVGTITVNTNCGFSYILLDDGSTLYVTDNKIGIDKNLTGKRIAASYNIVSEVNAGSVKNYNIELCGVSPVAIKSPIPGTTQQILGNSPIEIDYISFTGKYVNIGLAYMSAGTAEHTINLVAEIVTPDDIYLTLRHNAHCNKELTKVREVISFDISTLMETRQKSVTVHISNTDYKGCKTTRSGIINN